MIGLNLSQLQMQPFAVKGEIALRTRLLQGEQSASEHPSAKESRGSRVKSSSGALRAQVSATVSDQGSLSLGYNVQKFLQKYM